MASAPEKAWSSKSARAPMIVEEATSPPAWPHAVGHREQMRAGIPAVLVVGPDHAHVGAGRIVEGDRHRLPGQLDHGPPDAQRRPQLEGGGSGDPAVVDEGAIGGAEVLDQPAPFLFEDAGVPPRGRSRRRGRARTRRATDERALGPQRQGGAGQGPSVTTSLRGWLPRRPLSIPRFGAAGRAGAAPGMGPLGSVPRRTRWVTRVP